MSLKMEQYYYHTVDYDLNNSHKNIWHYVNMTVTLRMQYI